MRKYSYYFNEDLVKIIMSYVPYWVASSLCPYEVVKIYPHLAYVNKKNTMFKKKVIKILFNLKKKRFKKTLLLNKDNMFKLNQNQDNNNNSKFKFSSEELKKILNENERQINILIHSEFKHFLTDMYKVCPICHEKKILKEDFYRVSKKKPGVYQRMCKKCANKLRSKYKYPIQERKYLGFNRFTLDTRKNILSDYELVKQKKMKLKNLCAKYGIKYNTFISWKRHKKLVL